MMEEGVDPSYVPNDSGDSPLYMATHTNLDVKLLEKFIDYVKPKVGDRKIDNSITLSF
jgi:hypothetical protein